MFIGREYENSMRSKVLVKKRAILRNKKGADKAPLINVWYRQYIVNRG